MTRIFVVATLSFMFMLGNAQAEPGVLIEADSDTVMKVEYLGSSTGDAPILFVTGGKRYGAKVEGTWRGLTGTVPGYFEPYPGLPVGVAGAGPIGIAAYATGTSTPLRGAQLMAFSTNPSAYNYGAEIYVTGGLNTYGIAVTANGAFQNWAAWFNGHTYATGMYLGSDQMFKKNVVDYTGGLDRVMALKPRSYDMKTEEFKNQMELPKGRQIGLIAQELQAVLPEIVIDAEAPPQLTEEEQKAGVRKEGLKFKAVNYTALIPVLIAAIQEQQARIEALEAGRK